ncbi:MAG: hypothetical protein ABL934_00675 [Lysobacteraceae bacterium]
MASLEIKRRKLTGRASASHLGIPHYVLNSPQFGALNGWEIKLLVEVAGQYHGFNNGNLSCTWSQLASRGWRSNGTLRKSLKTLLEKEWLICTRHGGRNLCSLYAVSWWAINACEGKRLEVRPEKAPSNRWAKKTKSLGAK